MNKNEQIASDVLEAVGGKENVSNVLHCMTRLRFVLKDQSAADEEQIKKVAGVLGCQHAGGQLQVIIGQNVSKVYDHLCQIGGFEKSDTIDENVDGVKEKLTWKSVGGKIMDYISGSITPLIPIIMAAAMFKTVQAVLGSSMLNIIADDSDLSILLDFVYDAGFYFFPIYVGWCAAKKLNTSIPLAIFLGGIMIAPDFVALSGQPFTVFGIPCQVNSYANSIVPILLSVWIMSYVFKFFSNHVPTVLSTIFTPFLTTLVMLPLTLCLLAPLGNLLGEYIAIFLEWFSSVSGGLAVGVMGMAYCFMVMTGMHGPIVLLAIAQLVETGVDTLVFIGGFVSMVACAGMALGAFLRLKDKNEKTTSLGCFVTTMLSGVTEPALYGIGTKYKKPLIGMAAGGLVGGLYAGFTGVTYHVMISILVLGPLSYAAGGTANMINGTIAGILALIVSTVVTYFFGFDKKDIDKA